MAKYSIKCKLCGKVYGENYRLFRCSCGGVLEVSIDLRSSKWLVNSNVRGVFRYSNLLPDIYRHVSLGEGLTPTVVKSSENNSL
ncbi:MAG: hypothetical protein QW808_01840, partial [Desulfurococcaceae archaeon]